MSATEERPAARPILLAVDDDPAVARAVNRDLRRHYGARYRVLSTASGQEALNALEEITRRGEPVALLLADQRMPQMTGVEFMAEARALAPDARRVLLTAYADSQAAIDAINRVGLDRYLMKPWDPPEEQLYPALDDLLAAWHATRPAADDGLRVIGHRFSRASHELRDFLARNLVPFRYVDVERDAARAGPLLAAAGLDGDEPEGLPLVILDDGEALRAPDVAEVARARRHQHARRRASSTTSWWWAAVRRGWRRPSTARPRASRRRSSSGSRPAARPARARASRTTSASPAASAGRT